MILKWLKLYLIMIKYLKKRLNTNVFHVLVLIVLKIEKKKWFPQVYLEQCKYEVKERKIKSLIDYDLDSD